MVKTNLISCKNKFDKGTIVFLHGGPGMDSSYLLPAMNDLSSNHSLLFYDMGQGECSDYDIEYLLVELNEVIGSIDSKKIILFGHSFGSALALEYVGRYNPQSLHALIFVSWIYDNGWNKRLPRNLKKTIERVNSADYAGFSHDDTLKKQTLEYYKHYFNESCQDIGRKILNKISYNAKLQNDFFKNYLNHFDCNNILKKINVPILSIAGKGDEIVPIGYIQRSYDLIKNISTLELDNCAHFPFIEQQDSVLKEIKNFINQCNHNSVIAKKGE